MNPIPAHQQVERDKEKMRRPGPVFVPANDPLELPARQPQTAIDGVTGPVVIGAPAQQQKQAQRSFVGIQGTPENEAAALRMRFFVVFGLEAMAMGGLCFVAWLNNLMGIAGLAGGWVVIMGTVGIVSWIIMERQDHQHSPIGAQRHHTEETELTERQRIATYGEVQKHAIDRHFDAIEAQHQRDHSERLHILEERRRLTG